MAEYTNFTGFNTGMNVYVQVDSANNIVNNETGAVLEDHEITGNSYNNIGQIIVSLK